MAYVVINKKIGGFGLSVDQLEYLKDKACSALSKGGVSSQDVEMCNMIRDEYKHMCRFLKEHPTEQYSGILYPEQITDYYLYRSHPWLVEAVQKHPSEYATVEYVDNQYYIIIEQDDGTEHIITPSLEGFIKSLN